MVASFRGLEPESINTFSMNEYGDLREGFKSTLPSKSDIITLNSE